MMEPSKHREAKQAENIRDLRSIINDQSEDNDISLSKLRVNVRRQNSSKEEVYLGKFKENTDPYL